MATVHGASVVTMVGALLHRLNPLVKRQLDLVRSLPETVPSRRRELACLSHLFMTCPPGLMVLPYGCTEQAWESMKLDGWESVTTHHQTESFSQFYPLGEQSSTKPELGKQAGYQSTLAQAQAQDRATYLPFGKEDPEMSWIGASIAQSFRP